MESYMAQNNQFENITICRFEVAGWPTNNHKIYLEFKKKKMICLAI